MPDERAFAIHAPPAAIWALLLAEVRAGVEAGRASIVRQEAPRLLVVDVRPGWGLTVRYTYEVRVTPDHTEVAARVVPGGLRHSLANILALGRGHTPYLLALTQGLANLKQAAEQQRPDDGPPA